MYQQGKLQSVVQKYLDDVTARPAESVGPSLDRLKAALNDVDDGTRLARVAPVANLTWMNREILTAARLDSPQDNIKIPFKCRIVGAKVSMLLIDPTNGIVLPPPEAIDVFIEMNRRDEYTARADDRLGVDEDPQVVSLLALDTQEANRQMCIEMPATGFQVISVRYRWALPLATVALFGWGDTQISINWFIDPLDDGVRL